MESVFVVTYQNELNDQTEVAGVFAQFGDAAESALNLRESYKQGGEWRQDMAFDAKKRESGTRSQHWYNDKDQWVVVEEFDVQNSAAELKAVV